VARLEIEGGRIRRSGFLPLTIGRDAVPRFADPGSAEYADVVAYMRAVTQEAGLNARYTADADMVVLAA
jgi:hypothetical protein